MNNASSEVRNVLARDVVFQLFVKFLKHIHVYEYRDLYEYRERFESCANRKGVEERFGLWLETNAKVVESFDPDTDADQL